jgi:cation transport ATPase
MRLSLQLLIALLAASTVFAADITTRDGKTYKHAKVTGVDVDGLSITHSTGVIKVPFDNLPDALQKEYNYDPEKAAAARKAAEEAKEAEAAQAAAAQREREQSALKAEQEARRQADERRRQEHERFAAELRQKQIREMTTVVLVIVGVAIGALLYFVPSIVGRHKTNATAIFVFNFFLGWTFLGWVLALVWACTKDPVIETDARVGQIKEP